VKGSVSMVSVTGANEGERVWVMPEGMARSSAGFCIPARSDTATTCLTRSSSRTIRSLSAAFSAWSVAKEGSDVEVVSSFSRTGFTSRSAGGGATVARLTVLHEMLVRDGDGSRVSPLSARFSASSSATRTSSQDMWALRWFRERWADSRLRIVLASFLACLALATSIMGVSSTSEPESDLGRLVGGAGTRLEEEATDDIV